MTAIASEPWPDEHTIQQLVQRACGQFIYAATVIKYVDQHLPAKRLEIILNITVPRGLDSPYPALDSLYNQILVTSSETDCPQILDVLSYLIAPGSGIFFDSRYEKTTFPCIRDILFVQDIKLYDLLSGLHSVLAIPESYDHDNSMIEVLHASFVDFLTDAKRSGDYFVDNRAGARHERVVRHLLKRINHALENPKNRMDSQFDIYAWEHLDKHCLKANLTEVLKAELKKFDIHGFINMSMARRMAATPSLENCVSVLRRTLAIIGNIATFLSLAGAPSELTKRYETLNAGFQVHTSIPSTPGCGVSTEIFIEILKFVLIMHRPGMWELISALLDNRLAAGKVAEVSRSSLPSPPITVVAPPAGEEPSVDLFDIDLMECHLRVCIKCLHILRKAWISAIKAYVFGKSWNYSPETMEYATSRWIHHLRAVTPSAETIELLRRNTHFLQTSDDVEKQLHGSNAVSSIQLIKYWSIRWRKNGKSLRIDNGA